MAERSRAVDENRLREIVRQAVDERIDELRKARSGGGGPQMEDVKQLLQVEIERRLEQR